MPGSIIQVVPLRRFPRTKGLFDYEAPESIAVEAGDLVEIPFKSSSIAALVIGFSQQPGTTQRLKTIFRVIAPRFVSQAQLQLIIWLANYSAVSLAVAAKLAVPFIPSSKFTVPKVKAVPLTSTSSKKLPVNILPATPQQKERIVRSLVSKVIKRKQQILLLVPEARQIAPWLEIFKNVQGVASYAGGNKITELRSAWQDTYSGRAKIIIGTRSALWLNFHHLGGIIVDGAENENFFQSESNPRYDCLAAAKYLAVLKRIPLAQISVAPRLENWQASQKGAEQWRELSPLRTKIKVIDLTAAPKAGKTGLISEELKGVVDQALANQKKVLLYLNRRGAATVSICNDCGFVAVCPKCQRQLVQTSDRKVLACFHCGLEQTLAIPCPKCGGLSIDYRGGGVTKLAEEVLWLWPKATCAVVEAKFKTEDSLTALRADIILGSRTAVRASEALHLGLAAIIKADIELALPEFRSTERVWQLARTLAWRTDKLLIQTYKPDHYLWSGLFSKELESFYKAELELRKKYSYPPAGKLLRFTCQAKNEADSRRQADELKKILERNLPGNTEVVGPYPDNFSAGGKKWRWHILVKHDSGYDPSGLWPLLPEDAIVERDPWLILS